MSSTDIDSPLDYYTKADRRIGYKLRADCIGGAGYDKNGCDRLLVAAKVLTDLLFYMSCLVLVARLVISNWNSAEINSAHVHVLFVLLFVAFWGS